jgi:hypothetical protein
MWTLEQKPKDTLALKSFEDMAIGTVFTETDLDTDNYDGTNIQDMDVFVKISETQTVVLYPNPEEGMRFLTEDIKPQESFYVLGRATLSINLDRL